MTLRFLVGRVENSLFFPLRIWRTPHGVSAYLLSLKPGTYRVYEVHDGVVQTTFKETTR